MADLSSLQKELEKECKESEKNRNLYETLLQEHEIVRYQLAEARLYIDRLRIGIDSPFYIYKTIHEIDVPYVPRGGDTSSSPSSEDSAGARRYASLGSKRAVAKNSTTTSREGGESEDSCSAGVPGAGLTLPLAPSALDQISNLRDQVAVLEDSLSHGHLPFHSMWAGLLQLQQLHNQLSSDVSETETTENSEELKQQLQHELLQLGDQFKKLANSLQSRTDLGNNDSTMSEKKEESCTGLIPKIVIQPPTLERDLTSPDYADSVSITSTDTPSNHTHHPYSNENIETSNINTSLATPCNQPPPSFLVPSCHTLPCSHGVSQGVCMGVCPSPDTSAVSSSPQPQTDTGVSSIRTSLLNSGTPGHCGNSSGGNASTDTLSHCNDHHVLNNDCITPTHGVNQLQVRDGCDESCDGHEVIENGGKVELASRRHHNVPRKSQIPRRIGIHKTKAGDAPLDGKNRVSLYAKGHTAHCDHVLHDGGPSLNGETSRLSNSCWSGAASPRRHCDTIVPPHSNPAKASVASAQDCDIGQPVQQPDSNTRSDAHTSTNTRRSDPYLASTANDGELLSSSIVEQQDGGEYDDPSLLISSSNLCERSHSNTHTKYNDTFTVHPDHDTSTVHLGHDTSTIHPGHDTFTIHPGHGTSTIHPGHDTSTIHPGHDTSPIHPDYDTSTIHPGRDTSTIHPGHDTSTIHSGCDTSTIHPVHDTSTIHPGHDTSNIHPSRDTSTIHPGRNTSTIHPGHGTSIHPGHDISNIHPGHDTSTIHPGRDTSTIHPGHDIFTVCLSHDTSSSIDGCSIQCNASSGTQTSSLHLEDSIFPLKACSLSLNKNPTAFDVRYPPSMAYTCIANKDVAILAKPSLDEKWTQATSIGNHFNKYPDDGSIPGDIIANYCAHFDTVSHPTDTVSLDVDTASCNTHQNIMYKTNSSDRKKHYHRAKNDHRIADRNRKNERHEYNSCMSDHALAYPNSILRKSKKSSAHPASGGYSQEPKPMYSQKPKPLHSQEPKPMHSREPKPLHSQEPKPMHSREPMRYRHKPRLGHYKSVSLYHSHNHYHNHHAPTNNRCMEKQPHHHHHGSSKHHRSVKEKAEINLNGVEKLARKLQSSSLRMNEALQGCLHQSRNYH